MSTEVQKIVADWILSAGDVPYEKWITLSSNDHELLGILRTVRAAPRESDRDSPLKEFSETGLSGILAKAFPGRSAFTSRLASILEPWLLEKDSPMETLDSMALLGSLKPNVLIVGGRGTGKSYLLSQALPRAVHQSIEEQDHVRPVPGGCAYVDARFVRDFTGLHGQAFGPVQCARLLVDCSQENLSRWQEEKMSIICIDNIEQVWKHDKANPLAGESLAAALAGVMRGVECPLGHHGVVSRPTDETLVTDRVLFVAVARFENLRAVAEKRVGDSGDCELQAADLVAAGMPETLAEQFPIIIVLPSVSREDLGLTLLKQWHPGFEALRKAAEATAVEFTEDARHCLVRLCWEDPRQAFRRLNQVIGELAGLAGSFHLSDGVLTITPEDIGKAIQRNTVQPLFLNA